MLTLQPHSFCLVSSWNNTPSQSRVCKLKQGENRKIGVVVPAFPLPSSVRASKELSKVVEFLGDVCCAVQLALQGELTKGTTSDGPNPVTGRGSVQTGKGAEHAPDILRSRHTASPELVEF
jgi:hypothetical protein